MATPTLHKTLISPIESEKPLLNKIDGALAHSTTTPSLIGPGGEIIPLPMTIFRVLREVVFHMMRGRAIFLIPEKQVLTTLEAAKLLDVSRPFLVKLLDEGKIPSFKVGSHRRIHLEDLMRYKKLRDAEQKAAIDEIAQLSQDLGLYD